MLVSATNHPDHATQSAPPVLQRSWRLLGVRNDALTANDARRCGHAVSLEAAFCGVDVLCGNVEVRYQLHPERSSQKLDITLHATIPNHQADSTLIQRAMDQLESAYSLQHIIARCPQPRKNIAKESDPEATIEGRSGKLPSVGLFSTLELASLYPVPGQYSPGQPLRVRSSIDWSMFLSSLADVAEPVIIRFQSVAARRDALYRQLDEAQRHWQLHQKQERRRAKRQERFASDSQQPRPRPSAEDITSATRWATTALKALAEMAPFARHLLTYIDAPAPQTAHYVADFTQRTVFEPGTASSESCSARSQEVLPVIEGSGSADDLLSMAGTLCRTEEVARVLAGPLVDSPLMLPSMSASDDASTRKKTIVLGARFDEIVDRPSETETSLRLPQLTNHVSAFGKTGFGKTSFIYQFISECAHLDPPLPVAYITLAKNEGPALLWWLKNSDPRLKAYAEQMVFYGLHASAPLKPTISPFALEDASPIEQAEHAHRVLKSAIALEGPLMGNCLEACLDLCHGMQQTGMTPIIADLPGAIRLVQRCLGYAREVQGNLGGAADSRLGELTGGQAGELFRSPSSLPRIEDLLERPHIISCGLAPGNATAMFCIDLLLRLERWLITYPLQADDGRPRVALILDEIQAIAPRDPRSLGGDRPNASIEAAAIIAHCIKTLRSLGVSIIFASQHPRSISAELLKAPGTCLALRESQIEERQELAGLLSLSQQQCEQLNGLDPGHGYVRSPGMKRPQRVVIPFIAGVHDCPVLDDAELARHCAQSSHHRKLAIGSYQDQVIMREDRLLRAIAQLRQDRHRLRDLSQAAQFAKTQKDRPDTAAQLLAEIRDVATQVHSDLAQQSQIIERRWARTLTSPPQWLVDWAETARRSVKQKKQVVELSRRHSRLAGVYQHWISRAKRAMQQAKALKNP
jgi:hypothetical protein